MSVHYITHKDIFSFFRRLKNKDVDYVNKLIVSAFLKVNKIKVKYNKLILGLQISSNDDNYKKLLSVLDNCQEEFSFENLIEIFEFVISPKEKEVNGAVYTPAYIRNFIIDNIIQQKRDCNLLSLVYGDLSCGCGGFLYSLAKKIKEKIPYIELSDLYANNLVGIDIKDYSVERTKILLSLFAISQGEDSEVFIFNLMIQNTLTNQIDKISVVRNNNGLDVVVGNPPYVGAVKIDNENRTLLAEWLTTSTGKADLYIPFFEVGLSNLKEGGVLGYITVNNFYRSLNGRAFRQYISSRAYPFTIIDFGAEQVFPKCSTYTCLCFISKSKGGNVYYLETNSSFLDKIRSDEFNQIQYSDLDDIKGWLLNDNLALERIKRIENTGRPLGELFEIKNGFATLRNNIYIFKPYKISVKYFYLENEKGIFKIEKSICKDVIKPNILKKEEEISSLSQKLLFPYKEKDGRMIIIDEEEMKQIYPCAYKYLLAFRDELSLRDKGNKKYAAWYAFGRTQALNIKSKKLLFPYISNAPYFVYSDNEDLLFYNGYALLSNSKRQLRIIKRILESDIFWFYICKTSKPYGSSYFALAKNYVKYFGIPFFTTEQEDELLSFSSQQEVNQWLRNFY